MRTLTILREVNLMAGLWNDVKDLTYETLWGKKRPGSRGGIPLETPDFEHKETARERRLRLADEKRARKYSKLERERQAEERAKLDRENEYVELITLHAQTSIDSFLSPARTPSEDDKNGQLEVILPSDEKIREQIASDFRIKRIPEQLQETAVSYAFVTVKEAIEKGQSILQLNCSHFRTLVSRLRSAVMMTYRLDNEVRPKLLRVIEKGTTPPPPMETPKTPELDTKQIARQAKLSVDIAQAEKKVRRSRVAMTWYKIAGAVSAGLDLPIIFLSIYPRYQGTSMDIPGLIPLLTLTMAMTAITLAHFVVTKRWWAVPLLFGGVMALGSLRMPDISESFSQGLGMMIANISLVVVNILAIPIVAVVAVICFHKAKTVADELGETEETLKIWVRERDILLGVKSSIEKYLQDVRSTVEQTSRNYREMTDAYPGRMLQTVQTMEELLSDELADAHASMDAIVTGIRTQVMGEMSSTIRACARELAKLSWVKIEEISVGGDGHRQLDPTQHLLLDVRERR